MCTRPPSSPARAARPLWAINITIAPSVATASLAVACLSPAPASSPRLYTPPRRSYGWYCSPVASSASSFRLTLPHITSYKRLPTHSLSRS
ncbi:hypothetical protein BOTBODRAFT_181518 [Botryobasidium botryosum FD-172 SS1]|uniref:Uncharacterized protein n=1 Tax=Botryobasidium botryosum (strain FD-172 SS1) TaxID=930990 RepID=A0A067M3P1_BOTB1|nr:hypothetical protein BOTBODRAFT_181518 [Botryobasidium botryosum FD-172 SS1]